MFITLFTSILQFHFSLAMPPLSVALRMQLAQGYAIIRSVVLYCIVAHVVTLVCSSNTAL